jgi:diadenosine tetraphosphate (Ap4A) HIT family hydrolase
MRSYVRFHIHWFMISYNFLGNDFHHLHAHLIPRYNPARQVEFAGMNIKDMLWGKHFHTDKGFKTSREQRNAVRDALKTAMPKSAAELPPPAQ